jgi:cytochrome c-type biogenesis protein CcmH
VRVSRKPWLWALLLAVVVVALVVLVTRSQPSRSPRARADGLAHQLACPECEGESVADSNSVSARAIREDIPRRIAAGESDAEIREFYVSKYTEKVLRTPANSGIGLVAWVVPAAALFLGLAGVALALRRWSRTPRLSSTPEDEAIVSAMRGHDR